MRKFVDEPYVSLEIEGGGTWFSVLVNNIPVYLYYDQDYDPISLEIPINQQLINGKNTIELGLDEPVKEADDDEEEEILIGEKCYVKLTIKIKEKGSENSYDLGTVNYNAISGKIYNTPEKKYITGSSSDIYLAIVDGKVEKVEKKEAQFYIGEPAIKADNHSYYGANFEKEIINKHKGASVSNTFELELPYVNMIFTEGAKLDYNDATKQELVGVYKNIITYIKNKDCNALYSIFELQMRNAEITLYSSRDNVDIVKKIREKNSNPNFVFYDNIEFDNTYLNIFGNDNLAQLTFWDGSSILGFNSSDGSFSSSFFLTFAKIKGEWKAV